MKKIIILLLVNFIFSGCMSTLSSLSHSNEIARGNVIIKIEELLNNGNNINVLILMPKNEITHNLMNTDEYIDWVNRFRVDIISKDMSALLNNFSMYTNFSIVERNSAALDTIINEQVFSLSDLINYDTRIRIGNLAGSNYIHYFSYNRYVIQINNRKQIIDDTMYSKLISIETGEIITVDIHKWKIEYNYIFGNWNENLMYASLNGREVITDTRDNHNYYK